MIKILPPVEELNFFGAEKFVEIGNEAIQKRGFFTVALAGGSTPKSLYRLLSSQKFGDRILWNQVHFFFGDERNVLPDEAESNFRMAKENLFEPLEISEFHINRWKTELEDVEKIAQNYRETLFWGLKFAANSDESISSVSDKEDIPRFDLIILGMGADGHTASLFPYTKALRETEKFAVANYVEKLNDWRFTLTFPVINNARNVIFLVAGEEKAETLKTVLEGEFEPEKYPAQSVRPHIGELFWLVDEKAARLLQK